MTPRIAFYDFVLAYFPARVRFLLNEKKIDYEHEIIDIFHGDNLAPNFAKMNTSMTLPVLDLYGRIITQSYRICEALEGFGKKLGEGCDPNLIQKHVNLIKDWDGNCWADMNSKGPALSILGIFKEFQERYVLARLKECSSDEDLKSAYEKKLENIRKSYSAEEKDECKSQLVTILKTAEESLSTNKFLAGPSFSLADILLGSLLVRLRDAGTIKVDLQSHPVVSTYFKDIQQRQSFKDTFTGAEFAIASLLITLRDLPSIFLSKLTGRY